MRPYRSTSSSTVARIEASDIAAVFAPAKSARSLASRSIASMIAVRRGCWVWCRWSALVAANRIFSTRCPSRNCDRKAFRPGRKAVSTSAIVRRRSSTACGPAWIAPSASTSTT